jgi:predicted MPP superfamily phosphohydrolase
MAWLPTPGRAARALLLSLLAAGFWAAVLVLAVGFWARFVAPNRIAVEPVEVEAKGWPGGGPGELRIAFFSDLDLLGGPGRREASVLGIVRDLQPDLVAVGGDLFSGGREGPSEEVIEEVASWLGEVAAHARHGAYVVWGEQEVAFAERIESRFPPGVRSLETGQVIVPAGEARVRVCGPEGHFAPMAVEKGRLRAWGGATPTLARYLGAGSEGWGALEYEARLRYGRPGDGRGVGVLVGEEDPGVWLRISPESGGWSAEPRREGWKGRWAQKGNLPTRRWIRVRTRVEVGEEDTRVLSRAWPEGEPEPEGWQIELKRSDPQRPRGGSIGVVAGGPGSSAGGAEWEDLRVVSAEGALLLEESFEEARSFTADWENPGGEPWDFDATVLLLHSPLQQAEIDDFPFLDLALAGHTHGGQVRLPPFHPVAMDKTIPAGWLAGKVRIYQKRRWLYVTRGIGTSGLPVRLFCPPEVTDLTLRVIPRPPR